MNLHNIVPAIPTALIWFYVNGGNGRALDVHNGQQRRHLYRLRRTVPPPMDTPIPNWRNRHDRYYWQPWRQNITETEEILTPLCGRIKTKSQWPRLSPWGNHWRQDSCQDCLAIAAGERVHENIETVNRADPWWNIPREARGTTPDPLTGQ